MEIKRIGSQPAPKGPSEWFTGTVRIDPLFQASDPALVQGASVTFEQGRLGGAIRKIARKWWVIVFFFSTFWTPIPLRVLTLFFPAT